MTASLVVVEVVARRERKCWRKLIRIAEAHLILRKSAACHEVTARELDKQF